MRYLTEQRFSLTGTLERLDHDELCDRLFALESASPDISDADISTCTNPAADTVVVFAHMSVEAGDAKRAERRAKEILQAAVIAAWDRQTGDMEGHVFTSNEEYLAYLTGTPFPYSPSR